MLIFSVSMCYYSYFIFYLLCVSECLFPVVGYAEDTVVIVNVWPDVEVLISSKEDRLGLAVFVKS